MAVVVHIAHLTKTYGKFTALNDCSLEISEGEVFGLLGPNGSGKTTLLRLLLGFLSPTSGRSSVLGLDCYRQSLGVRRLTAYLPADVRLFRRMSAAQYLGFQCSLRQEASLKRSLEIADELQLEMDRRIGLMSTGMRQKLALVGTLAAGVRLMILDEPTANLDPNVRATVARRIRELASQGTTVLFSSHVLPEVEQCCDRVAIMHSGQVAVVQEMSTLQTRYRISARIKQSTFRVDESLASEVVVLKQTDSDVVFETTAQLAKILKWLSSLDLTDISIANIGLQSVYDDVHPTVEGQHEQQPADCDLPADSLVRSA